MRGLARELDRAMTRPSVAAFVWAAAGCLLAEAAAPLPRTIAGGAAPGRQRQRQQESLLQRRGFGLGLSPDEEASDGEVIVADVYPPRDYGHGGLHPMGSAAQGGVEATPGARAIPNTVAMARRLHSKEPHEATKEDDKDDEEKSKPAKEETTDNPFDDPSINPFHEDSQISKDMHDWEQNVSQDVDELGKEKQGPAPVSLNNRTAAEAAMHEAGPTFEDLDGTIDRDNVVTQDEAATWGMKNGVPWSEMKGLFIRFDENNNSRLEKGEFEAAEPNSQAFLNGLGATFEDIDYNGDKLVSEPEWLAFCHGWMTPKPSESKCKEIFHEADTDAPHDLIDQWEFAGDNATQGEPREDEQQEHEHTHEATKDDVGSMLRGSLGMASEKALALVHAAGLRQERRIHLSVLVARARAVWPGLEHR
jgi:hypothetical protein